MAHTGFSTVLTVVLTIAIPVVLLVCSSPSSSTGRRFTARSHNLEFATKLEGADLFGVALASSEHGQVCWNSSRGYCGGVGGLSDRGSSSQLWRAFRQVMRGLRAELDVVQRRVHLGGRPGPLPELGRCGAIAAADRRHC